MANQAKAKWRTQLLATLPAEDDVIRRNAAITAHYATWYRDHRPVLKWAGAAAFVSHTVGLALLPYKIIAAKGAIVNIVTGLDSPDDRRDQRTVLGDLDLIRTTNNNVFTDIGWAHFAYAADDGGLAAVEAAAEPGDALLVQGFQEIDAGRQLLATDTSTAATRIWAGNQLLLRHEQLNTVQPQLGSLRPEYDLFFSVMTNVDFDGRNERIDLKSTSAFQTFMLEHKGRPGDFRNFDDRWFWVENGFLPKWREADATEPELPQRIERLIAQGPQR